MRTPGKEHAGAKKFCSLMNMPPPSAAQSYRKASCVIGRHFKCIAKESMKKAGEVKSLKETSSEEGGPIYNCGVSCHGTWQKRGDSSLNGCVTVISIDTGKVLDVEALNLSCKQCQLHVHMDKTSNEYLRWIADHNTCKANFKGSAPAMEQEGSHRIFQRSVETQTQAR